MTRVLNLLGALLPSRLVEADRWNERGFWESLEVMRLHDQLLAAFSSAWDDPSPLDFASGGDAAGPFYGQLRLALERDFANAALFAIKDPRICRFVPLWRSLFDELGATAHAALIVRNPLEVAASLHRRDKLLPRHAYRLWLQHVLDAERATRSMPRGFILYGDLVSRWRPAIEKLLGDAGLPWLKPGKETAAAVDDFLSVEMPHAGAGSGDLPEAASELLGWLRRAYAALSQMVIVADNAKARAELDAVGAAFDSTDRTLTFLQ